MDVEQAPTSVPVLRGCTVKTKGSKVKPDTKAHRVQVSAPRSHQDFTEKCTSRWEAKSGPKEWTSCSEIDVFKQPGPNKHLKNVAEPSGSISSHWRPVKRLPKRWEKKNQGGLNFLVYLKTRKNIGWNSHTACKHPEDDKDISLDGLVKNRCVKSI